MESWDDVRIFLAVTRSGSLAAAGRLLGVDATTVGRRLRALEARLGVPLFERVRDRHVPTEAGEALRPAAEEMESAALAVERRALAADRTLSGTLRVTTTEGLAQRVVLPALEVLHARHPAIRLVLLTGGARLDIVRREADVAVRYVRPDAGELVARRLVRVAVAFYASRGYLDRRPAPPRGGSIRGHDVVALEEGFRPWARALPDARTVLRANTMRVLRDAVALGMGIGAVHCWMAAEVESLVRVWPDEPLDHDEVFVVMHRDVQRTARVRAFVDALEQRVRLAAPELEGRPAA